MLIGEIIIVISGIFLGYIFPDLLHEYGADEGFSYSYISPVGLAILPFIAYVTRPMWINWKLSFAGIQGFTGSIFILLSITLLIGGYVRIIQNYLANR